MKVSLCMIVRDEEEMLPHCLQSVEQVVDEIVVIDTGSRDRTREIAMEHGAKVYDYVWDDDFGKARNYSLSQATGDWILVLDADERLSSVSVRELRQVLKSCPAEGIRVTIRTPLNEGRLTDYLSSVATRLFRNRKEYCFEPKLYEQIDASIINAALGPPPQESTLVIEHLWCSDCAPRRRSKREHKLRLAEALCGRVDDGFSHFRLGMEYMRNKRYNEALAALDKAENMLAPGLVVAAWSLCRRAMCLVELLRPEEALAAVNGGLKAHPNFTDLLYLKGEILRELKRFGEALSAFAQCRAMDFAQRKYSSLGTGTFRAAYSLGVVHHGLLNYAEALGWYRVALRENPEFRLCVYRIAEVLRATLPKEAVSLELAKYFNLTTLESRCLYLDVLFTAGQYETCRELALELAQGGVTSALVLGRGAESAFHCRDWAMAQRFGQELMARGIDLELSLLHTLVVTWVTGDLPSGQQTINRLAQLKNDMLRAVCQQMQWYAEGRQGFSLCIDFSDHAQNSSFHHCVLSVLRLVVVAKDPKLLAQVLPILSPLEGHKAWLQLGLYYYKYGYPDLAYAELKDCEEQGTYTAESLLVLGRLALAAGEPYRAVEYFMRSLELEPHQVEARLLLVRASAALGKAVLKEGRAIVPEAQALYEAHIT